MAIHIGSIVRKVLYDKRVKPGDLAKRIGVHIGSISRILGYGEMNTGLLKKLSVALGYDFFGHYSDELKLGRGEKEVVTAKEMTSCEKLLEDCVRENEGLKKEVAYLKEINGLLGKK